MYEKHFGLRERPFSLLPDPAFFYQTAKHTTAFASLAYGLLNDAPVVLITTEIGACKTTLFRFLREQMAESSSLGLISNTHRSFGSLIQLVSLAFGLPLQTDDRFSLFAGHSVPAR